VNASCLLALWHFEASQRSMTCETTCLFTGCRAHSTLMGEGDTGSFCFLIPRSNNSRFFSLLQRCLIVKLFMASVSKLGNAGAPSLACLLHDMQISGCRVPAYEQAFVWSFACNPARGRFSPFPTILLVLYVRVHCFF
jgi:hypothetical protein